MFFTLWLILESHLNHRVLKKAAKLVFAAEKLPTALGPLSHTKPKLHPPKVVYNPARTAAVYLDLAPLTIKIADNLKASGSLLF